jgi:hypothetical protein
MTKSIEELEKEIALLKRVIVNLITWISQASPSPISKEATATLLKSLGG